jgi:hypothetical protein
VLSHQQKRISQDGLYQKLEELPLKSLKQIEIKPMILVQPSDLNSILKTEQVNNATLDQAIEGKLRDLEHSKIKCKEEQVSNYTIQNGESHISFE